MVSPITNFKSITDFRGLKWISRWISFSRVLAKSSFQSTLFQCLSIRVPALANLFVGICVKESKKERERECEGFQLRVFLWISISFNVLTCVLENVHHTHIHMRIDTQAHPLSLTHTHTHAHTQTHILSIVLSHLPSQRLPRYILGRSVFRSVRSYFFLTIFFSQKISPKQSFIQIQPSGFFENRGKREKKKRFQVKWTWSGMIEPGHSRLIRDHHLMSQMATWLNSFKFLNCWRNLKTWLNPEQWRTLDFFRKKFFLRW